MQGGQPHIKLKVHDQTIDALVDSGAQKSIVSTSFIQKNKLWSKIQKSNIKLKGLNDYEIKNHGSIDLKISFINSTFETVMNFFVVPSAKPIIIIGSDFCDRNNCDILFSQKCISGPNIFAPMFLKYGTTKIKAVNVKRKTFWLKHIRPCIVKKLHKNKPKLLFFNEKGNFATTRNFSSKTVKPKQPVTNNSKNNHIFLSQKELTIPPNSEIISRVSLSDQLFQKLKGKQVYFEPKPWSKYSPVGAGRAILNVTSKQVPICFINLSHKTFTIQRFKMLGTFIPLDDTFQTIPYEGKGDTNILTVSIEQEKAQRQLTSEELDKDISRMIEKEPWLKELDIGELDLTQKHLLFKLLIKYHMVFAKNRMDIGKTNIIEAELNVKCDKPVYTRQYPLNAEKREILENEIEVMKQMDLIEDSNSPFNSPLILVKKADSSFRIVSDFRKINKYIEEERTELPSFQESLEILGNNRYFSSLDLAQAYLQVPLSKESRKYTASSVGSKHFQYRRLPYGLKNNTSIFQSMMNLLLGEMQYKRAMVYVDDCLLFSKTFSDHITNLTELLEKLKSAKLKLKPSKCSLLKSQVTYLGHIITEQGIIPSPKKIQAVADFGTPTNPKQVKQWLGLTGYFRRFVADYATIAAPLTELTKPSCRFKWTNVENESFLTLKARLMNPPILAHPNVNQPYTVTADASSYGVGAILSQKNEKGEEHVISYYSKKLSPTQRNYSATDLELLACSLAIDQFRPYLFGRKFTLVTDHRPIIYLQNLENPSSRYFRFIMKLQELNFSITHRQGILHGSVDALSRDPQFQDSLNTFKNSKVNMMKQLLVNSNHLLQWKKLLCTNLGIQFEDTEPENPQNYEKFDDNCFYKEISKVISNDKNQFQKIREAVHTLTSGNKKFLEKAGYFGQEKTSSHMQGIKNSKPAELVDIKTTASLLKLPIILKQGSREELIFGSLESKLTPFPPVGAVIVLEQDQFENWIWTNKDLSLPGKSKFIEETPSRNIKKASRHNRDPGDKIIFQDAEDSVEEQDATINVIELAGLSKKERFHRAQENLKKKTSDAALVRLYAVKKQTEPKSLYIPNAKEISSCQIKDNFCQQWINYLRDGSTPKLTKKFFKKYQHNYKLNDDGVLIYTPNIGLRKGEKPVALMVVPLNLVKFILESLHVYMSHIGIKKTMHLASQHYHRPGLKKLIAKYINSCSLCQNKAGNRKKNFAEVQRIAPATDRFSIWSIDCVGPITSSHLRRNKFIITMIDHFTRWVELVPVTNIKAETVADKMLIHLISRFGCPNRIHSDNAQNFHSKLMTSLCKALNIKRTFTSALSPMSNGMLEKFHLFLGNALKLTVDENQRDWDTRLPHLLLAYRTTHQRSIDDTPAFVVYGADLKLPTQLLTATRDNPNNLDAHYKGTEVSIKFQEARETYRKVMEKHTSKSREDANKNRTTNHYKVGDIVLMRKPLTTANKSQKLHRPYVGDFRIIKKNGNVNYVIQQKNGTKQFKVHINRIIKWDPSFIDLTSSWAEEAEEIFEADEIIHEDELNINSLWYEGMVNEQEQEEEEDTLVPCSIDNFISREY